VSIFRDFLSGDFERHSESKGFDELQEKKIMFYLVVAGLVLFLAVDVSCYLVLRANEAHRRKEQAAV
jgi:hypothetical protein